MRSEFLYKTGLVALFIVFGAAGNLLQAQEQEPSYTWNYAGTQHANQLQGRLSVAHWAEELERRSNGRMEVRIHPAGSLVSDAEMVDAVNSGVANFGFINAGYWPADFPLWVAVGTLHDLDLTLKLGPVEQVEVARQLMEEFPRLESEFDARGLKILFIHAAPAAHIISREPIESLEDLEGKKIRTYGTGIPKMFTAIGAVPVSMPSAEIYSSLQTGAIDGAYTIADTFSARRLDEVAEHVTLVGNAPFLSLGLTTVMSKEAWEALPEGDQRILEEVSRETEEWLSQKTLEQEEAALATLRARGVTIHELTDAQIEEWRNRLPDLYKEAAEEMEDRGAPGEKFIETLKQTASEVADRE